MLKSYFNPLSVYSAFTELREFNEIAWIEFDLYRYGGEYFSPLNQLLTTLLWLSHAQIQKTVTGHFMVWKCVISPPPYLSSDLSAFHILFNCIRKLIDTFFPSQIQTSCDVLVNFP